MRPCSETLPGMPPLRGSGRPIARDASLWPMVLFSVRFGKMCRAKLRTSRERGFEPPIRDSPHLQSTAARNKTRIMWAPILMAEWRRMKRLCTVTTAHYRRSVTERVVECSRYELMSDYFNPSIKESKESPSPGLALRLP